jgi:hypothetical protein
MLHVVYINSCGPEDGRWTIETCHVEFYNDIPVITAYIVVLCVTVYIAPRGHLSMCKFIKLYHSSFI